MTLKLLLRDIAAAIGAQTSLTGEAASFSIDSRAMEAGGLFFALPGERVDGHDFVADVLSRGAAAAVVSRPVTDDAREMRVPDVLAALQQLARWAAKRWGGVIVGVTGSAGKTSTKDVIASLLEQAMPVGRTAGNFNNHIGLPLSVLRVPDDARVAVLEYGMNHAGEIRALAEIARPQVAVVTNVGYAHVENFEDGIEGIARSKREIVEALPDGGTAVLNYDDERVRSFAGAHRGKTIFFGVAPEADVHSAGLELREDGARFCVSGTAFETRVPGKHAVRNILAGIAVAGLFGVEPARLQEAVKGLRPGKMRGERLSHRGIEIINDCYNSNPEAVREMLAVLRGLPARRHIAVLGEMLELGRWSGSLHRETGEFATRCGISVLVGIRGEARALVEGAVEAGLPKDAAYFFPQPEEAGTWLRTFAREGDAILFKGSRGTRVERALETFLG